VGPGAGESGRTGLGLGGGLVNVTLLGEGGDVSVRYGEWDLPQPATKLRVNARIIEKMPWLRMR
jgi:hypothetical protein